MRNLRLLIGPVAIVLLVGCGPSGPTAYPVSGKVTWNGQPLTKGSITFAAEDGRTSPDAGAITDGSFSLRAKPGKKRVEIQADRPAGPVDPAMGVAPRQSYIPARYNTQTSLTAEVTPSGKNEFTFDLTGEDKPKPPH